MQLPQHRMKYIKIYKPRAHQHAHAQKNPNNPAFVAVICAAHIALVVSLKK